MRWARVAVSLLCCASLSFATVEPSAAPRGSRERPRWLACDRWTDTATPSVRGDGSYFDVEVVDPWHASASVGGWPSRPSPLAMRWTGRRWRRTTMPELRRAGTLEAIVATGRGSAWAVGTLMWRPQVDGGASLILRLSDGRWRAIRSPDIGVLGSVAATGPRDALAAGRGWGLLRWDGDLWSRVPDERMRGSARLEPTAVAYSTAGDAWIVGNIPSRYRHGDPQTYTPVAYHRTSSGWARTNLRRFGSPSWVRAIDVATPHDVWAVGTLGVFGGSIPDPVDAGPIAQHWC